MLANAFSLNMIEPGMTVITRFATLDEARAAAAHSVVGHCDTAGLFAVLLDEDVAVNRATVKLREGDRLVVGQYTGPRLSECVTELPEGAAVVWWMVLVD